MKSRVSRTLVPAVLLCAAASVWAQAPKETKPAETFTNLKVLPKDIPPDQLRALMSSISRALGVRCEFCHAIEEGKPHTNLDFAKDDKPTKTTARAMMQMTMDINQKYLANLPHREEPAIQVQCVTCHHGTTEPRTLSDVLTAEYKKEGLDSTVVRYNRLRDRYYGRAVYDFGETSLGDVGRQVQALGHPEDAAKLYALNVEVNPKSNFAKRMYANSSIAEAYYQAGPDSGAAVYRRFKAQYGDNLVSEEMLNDVGYQLLSGGKTKEAIAAFKLNVAEHPNSGNAYDSLGEGYATAGNTKEAKAAYEKSLKLDPSNENAKHKLAELKKGKKAKK
jgi:tetratricopeptide (TPR) repeat protein